MNFKRALGHTLVFAHTRVSELTTSDSRKSQRVNNTRFSSVTVPKTDSDASSDRIAFIYLTSQSSHRDADL